MAANRSHPMDAGRSEWGDDCGCHHWWRRYRTTANLIGSLGSTGRGCRQTRRLGDWSRTSPVQLRLSLATSSFWIEGFDLGRAALQKSESDDNICF